MGYIMGHDVEATFSLTEGGITFYVSVVLYGGAEVNFWDRWEGAYTNREGVTIANPNPGRSGFRYFRPLNESLAELTADYAKQRRENPESDAYDELQRQLVRDIDACEYGFTYTAKVGTAVILSGKSGGFNFDWSEYDSDSLEEVGAELFRKFCLPDAVAVVADKCRELVGLADQLRGVAESYAAA